MQPTHPAGPHPFPSPSELHSAGKSGKYLHAALFPGASLGVLFTKGLELPLTSLEPTELGPQGPEGRGTPPGLVCLLGQGQLDAKHK